MQSPIVIKYGSFYKSWSNMKDRCKNPHNKEYKRYAGRGISYDPYWEKFDNFRRDMFSTWKQELTIDRIDNNKGYSKENCRWATRMEQSNNTRKTIHITYKDITATISEWAKITGLKRHTIETRLFVYKWSIKRALQEKIYARIVI